MFSKFNDFRGSYLFMILHQLFVVGLCTYFFSMMLFPKIVWYEQVLLVSVTIFVVLYFKIGPAFTMACEGRLNCKIDRIIFEDGDEFFFHDIVSAKIKPWSEQGPEISSSQFIELKMRDERVIEKSLDSMSNKAIKSMKLEFNKRSIAFDYEAKNDLVSFFKLIFIAVAAFFGILVGMSVLEGEPVNKTVLMFLGLY